MSRYGAVRGFVFLLVLVLPFFVSGSDCEGLNENIYKDEVRPDVPGLIYKVNVQSGAFIYSAPDGACRSARFLIGGDKVQVYSEYGGYVSVMYFGDYGNIVEGWMQKKLLISTGESVSPSE